MCLVSIITKYFVYIQNTCNYENILHIEAGGKVRMRFYN